MSVREILKGLETPLGSRGPKAALKPRGGYTHAPGVSGGVEYIKPQFLQGKRVLENVALAEKLAKKTLKIERIPFVETVPEISGKLRFPPLAKKPSGPPKKVYTNSLFRPGTS